MEPRAEIVGFTLQGPPPLGIVHLPYVEGMTVLYGPNGAGKTTILNALADSLNGTGGAEPAGPLHTGHAAIVHFRLTNLDGPASKIKELAKWEDGLAAIAAFLLLQERSRFREGGAEPSGELDFLEFDRGTDETIADIICEAAQVRGYDHGGQALFSAAATGKNADPSWSLWTSGVPDELAPQFSRDLERTIAWTVFTDRLRNAENLDSRDLTDLLDLAGAPGPSVSSVAALIEHASSLDSGEDLSLRHVLGWLLFPGLERNGIERIEGMKARVRRAQMAENDADFIATMKELLPIKHWWANQTILDDPDPFDGSFDGDLDEDWSGMDLFRGKAPPWVPVPVTRVCTDARLPFPRVLKTEETDIEKTIVDSLNDLRWRYGFFRQRAADNGKPLPNEGDRPEDLDWFRAGSRPILDDIAAEANRFLAEVAPIPTVLECGFLGVSDWMNGHPIGVSATDYDTGQRVRFSSLSTAQQRWGTIALLHGIESVAHRASGLVLFDEPEAALHRRAAIETVERLSSFTRKNGLATYVASHSEPFLAARDAHLFHVDRSDWTGLAQATPVDRLRLDDLARTMDLDATEILQLTRVFVLVEGAHDEVVLEALLGETLAEERARLLPIRGVDGLTTLLDSEILLPYTNARLLLVLDHITDPPALLAAWNQARDVARTSAAAARSVFGDAIRSMGSKTKEDNTAIDLAFRLLRSEYSSRVEIFGFTRPGIEKYLPIDAFTSTPDLTWEGLDKEYMSLPFETRRRESEKDWLRQTHGIDITTDSIQFAVDSMDSGQISDEFGVLAEAIRRSTEPRHLSRGNGNR